MFVEDYLKEDTPYCVQELCGFLNGSKQLIESWIQVQSKFGGLDESYELFRGMSFHTKAELNNFIDTKRIEHTSHWTTHPLVAECFAKSTNFGSHSIGCVFSTTVDASDVVFDYRSYSPNQFFTENGGPHGQFEIIVKPGHSNFKMMHVFDL